jgi:uncharacterized glyoxalase superfamily protein PhnB
MNPAISVITLGVKNFKKSLDFYKNGFGWPTRATKKDSIAFFKLNGVILALYERRDLAKDANVSSEGSGFSGITLAHNAKNEKDVDEIFALALKLGAKAKKRPQKTFWGGYSGYFSDPDGYLWEVVYNPSWKIDRNGSAILR